MIFFILITEYIEKHKANSFVYFMICGNFCACMNQSIQNSQYTIKLYDNILLNFLYSVNRFRLFLKRFRNFETLGELFDALALMGLAVRAGLAQNSVVAIGHKTLFQ